MTPLRAQMTQDMQLQRLAPKTQKASIAAVAGLAKFSGCAPDQLRPDQIRAYLRHLLVERHLAWSSCNQVACGLKFFYVTPLGWDALHLHLPPRTGRRLLPHLMSVEELQRLFTSAATPRDRALLMTTYAAGLRVGEVVRLRLTDIDSDRLLIRVNQGTGRQDRYTLLSARLLAELRAYGKLSRPGAWLFPGHATTQPLPLAPAPTRSYRAKRAAGITHGKGLHTLRPCVATPLLAAGVDLRTIHLLLGHRSIDTTTRSLHITRQHLAKVHSPFALLAFGDTPCPQTESRHACTHRRWFPRGAAGGLRQTLLQCGRQNLGGQLGGVQVLHTWEQTLGAPFHVHCLVPGGVLADEGTRWTPTHSHFFLPVHALSTVFRGKFLDALHASPITDTLVFSEETAPLATPQGLRRCTDQLYAKAWAVYAKRSLAGPEHVLDSLSRYTHRGAIANHRIVDVQDGQGRFTYRNRRQGNRVQTMTLAAHEFIRRFLLHVVPQGLQRMRHIGFLANRCKARALRQCRQLLDQPSDPPSRPVKSVAEWLWQWTGTDITRCCGSPCHPCRIALPPCRHCGTRHESGASFPGLHG